MSAPWNSDESTKLLCSSKVLWVVCRCPVKDHFEGLVQFDTSKLKLVCD